MSRRKLTPEQMAAKVAKMKATKAANKAAALKEVGYNPKTKKYRKKRVMTEEQKAAAVERLAKARAAKKSKNPQGPKNVHPSVLERPEDDILSLKNVREWIKFNKEMLSEERRAAKLNMKGAAAKVTGIEGYIRNIEHYIRSGDWVDDRYGRDQQHRVKYRVIAMAYHHEGPYKGMVKRDVGCIYPDVGMWTQEMHDDYYDINSSIDNNRKKSNVKRNTVSRKTRSTRTKKRK